MVSGETINPARAIIDYECIRYGGEMDLSVVHNSQKHRRLVRSV